MRVIFFLFLCLSVTLPVDAQVDSISRISIGTGGVQSDGSSDAVALGTEDLAEGATHPNLMIAFRSKATNLVSPATDGVQQVYLYNPSDGTMTLVSKDGNGGTGDGDSAVAGSDISPLSMSPLGTFLAFGSDARDLPGDGRTYRDVFKYDVKNQRLSLASLAFSVLQCSDESQGAVISDDGRYTAFMSKDTSIGGTFDTNSDFDVMRYDSDLIASSLYSKNVSDGAIGGARSGPVSMSANGNLLAFVSSASNLIDDDTNSVDDIYLRDVSNNSLKRITNGVSGESNGNSLAPYLSADGSFVVFASHASNLVASDSNGLKDVFLYDDSEGKIELISKSVSGGAANGASYQPSVSNDGRFVAFLSAASNLVSGDTNGVVDAFVYDRTSRVTLRVSTNAANYQIVQPASDVAVSRDGTYAAFSSADEGLISGDTNEVSDVFLVKPSKVLFPGTSIEEAPQLTVVRHSITVIMDKYRSASLAVGGAAPASLRAGKPLKVQYRAELRGTGSQKGLNRTILSKRNVCSFKRLPPGTYKVGYRVVALKKDKKVFGTRKSPTAIATVN